MDKQEILFLFEKQAATSIHCDAFSLASAFAECLGALSERLSQDELEHLIRIGSGIYECGVRECGKGVPVEDLLPASECWAKKIGSSLYL
jgi:hypothetical protein